MLGRQLQGAALDPRDRGLATQLVYGTLAWQGLFDRAITQYGRDPQRLDVEIRTLLRLALFQLVRLERVPDFAAVNTAVELSKKVKHGAASGLVNALLRRFLREGKRIELPPRDVDLAAHLAAAWSHPHWLVERWLAELGPDQAEALLQANNQPAPTALRVNRRRTNSDQLAAALAAQGVTARRSQYAPDALLIDGGGDPTALPGYRDGWFTLQGEASQLVAALVGASTATRILDLCAAPGGKTTALAQEAAQTALIVAVDRHRAGLHNARRAAARLGTVNMVAACADGRALPLAAEWTADAVLVDAPCSGLGTLRQHPEIRWRRGPKDLRSLSELQLQLLHAAAARVRAGGALVYATCTISGAENADVVAAFLEQHPELSVDDPRPYLPAAAHELVDVTGALRTFPHRHGLDGFFAVRLKRAATVG